ncbi:MAG: FprA family A-type flavoprotein [Clostridia bacterium]|nr:FprA family A-type flavoprotein [Clostridia bacterium]
MEVKITDSIKYIGTNDYELDLFESQYIVPNGMAYNSYLILDEKTAVMAAADKRMIDQWLQNIENELGDKAPDYLVIQHLEPDHTGSVAAFCKKYPAAKLVMGDRAAAMFPQFAAVENEIVVVKNGEELALGSHTLCFTAAPMVHWPEVMMCYETSEKVLFAADAFGKFGTLDTDEDWACEARRYYFNIVGKYGAQVQALLKKYADTPIEIICPLHGPILSENLGYYLDLYNTWSQYKPESEGTFVAVASIHGHTLEAAEYFAEQLKALGEPKVAFSEIPREDSAECVEDAFRYPKTVFFACSYDAGLFPPMEELLMHLRDKTYRNRKVALVQNGSWAPSAGRVMKEYLDNMQGIEYIGELITIKTSLTEENKAQLRALAELVHNA